MDLDQAVAEMEAMALGRDDLAQPISLTYDGKIATVGDLISFKAPKGAWNNFHAAFGGILPPLPVLVKRVDKLKHRDLKRVALEVFRKKNPDERISLVPFGTCTAAEAVSHIERKTDMASRVIATWRLTGILTEKAIEAGKIEPVVALNHCGLAN